MRSSNPAFNTQLYDKYGGVIDREGAMTVNGTIAKTALLLLLCLITAGWTWMQFLQASGNVASIQGYLWLGLIGGLVAAIATAFKPMWASITGPIYALLEGFVIGGLSAVFEAQFPGIVIQAVGLTFGTMAAMLALYQSGLIPVTDKLRMGIFAATGGIAIVYFATIILGFFGVNVSLVTGNSLFSIGFSLFVVAIAALNLILDFDMIERGAQRGMPKFMEWYGAFALMVTLIWLYIEFLRLLSKVRSR